jgi:hypothetical protein
MRRDWAASWSKGRESWLPGGLGVCRFFGLFICPPMLWVVARIVALACNLPFAMEGLFGARAKLGNPGAKRRIFGDEGWMLGATERQIRGSSQKDIS